MFLFVKNLVNKYRKIIKYIIAGGTAAATDIVLIIVFTDGLKIHYLYSAMAAFIVAFFISFFLQKFWTFEDGRKDRMHKQMLVYLVVAVVNLGLNTYLMYISVDKLHIHYALSQIIISLLISITSFGIYNLFIFKDATNLKQNAD